MAKKQPSFEEALQRLEAIAEQIERGEIGLEDSIRKYEEGMKLLDTCRNILNQAEQRISRLQPEAGAADAADSAQAGEDAAS
ncbi:MAG: exodeoxyribonuclease VII small subunit [Phycisphaerae bacterium]